MRRVESHISLPKSTYEDDIIIKLVKVPLTSEKTIVKRKGRGQHPWGKPFGGFGAFGLVLESWRTCFTEIGRQVQFRPVTQLKCLMES